MTTRSELIKAVPVHLKDGFPYYVDLDEIPQPWRDQFYQALYGCQCPLIEGVRQAAYAWDWQSWAEGSLSGAWQGPQGLDRDRDTG